MPSMYSVQLDLLQDEHGDLIFRNGDIAASTRYNDITICNAHHRLMSSKDDLKFDPEYGPSLQEFIGRPVSEDLAKEMVAAIDRSFMDDLFFANTGYMIIPIVADDKIYIKISFKLNPLEDREYTELNIVFDPIGGITYVR